MRSFEEKLVFQLTWLLRAGVDLRGVRIMVYEEMVTRLVREPVGPSEVIDAIEACLQAARRTIRGRGIQGNLMETVLESALDAVRGHGGETSRWFGEVTRAVSLLLKEFERESEIHFSWGGLLDRY